MRKAEAERWSRALRSGKYVKYTGALRSSLNPNQCCVMGVAALVLPGVEWEMTWSGRGGIPTQIKVPNGEISIGIAVPQLILKLWAMHPDWATVMAMLNDQWHLTFGEMATVIDSRYSEFAKPTKLRPGQMAIKLSNEFDERKAEVSGSQRRRTRRKVAHNG